MIKLLEESYIINRWLFLELEDELRELTQKQKDVDN